MYIRRRLATACLSLGLLVSLAGCGLNAAGDPAQDSATLSGSAGSGSSAPSTSQPPAFGKAFTYPSGLAVTVSRPRAFTPSNTARPRVQHAVAFEVTIVNSTDRLYRLPGLVLTASVNGQPSDEVVDSTQGYTGFANASTDLPPARKITLLLAFGSDTVPATAGLRVQPDPRDPSAVEFAGEVSG